MNIHRISRRLAFVAGLTFSVAALGQDTLPSRNCKEKETWGKCLERLRNEAAEASNKEVADRLEERGQAQLTGTALTAVGGASSKRGFLPGLFTAFGVDDFQDRDGALALVYNTRPIGTRGARLSGEILLRQATVFEQLSKAIPEDERESQVAALEKALTDFDDVGFKVVLTVGGTSESRFVADYDKILNGPLFALASDSLLQPKLEAQDLVKEAVLKSVTLGGFDGPSSFGSQPAQELDALLKEAADRSIAHTEALVETLRSHHYFEIADLMANQPQLYFTLSGSSRDKTAGTDAYQLMATWELPLAPNINGLRAFCDEHPELRASAEQAGCSLRHVQSFVAANQARMASKDRLKFEIAVGREKAYDFALPELGVDLHLDAVSSIQAMASYGRSLLRDDEGKDLSRFDFETNYEHVTGDEKRNKRWTATASLTEKLTDDMSFVVSAVWANKPKYRGEVDDQWSAQAGLRYKIDRKEK